MLERDPQLRLSATDCLAHQWVKGTTEAQPQETSVKTQSQEDSISVFDRITLNLNRRKTLLKEGKLFNQYLRVQNLLQDILENGIEVPYLNAPGPKSGVHRNRSNSVTIN